MMSVITLFEKRNDNIYILLYEIKNIRYLHYFWSINIWRTILMAMNPYLEFILQLMAQILGDGNDRKNFASRDIDWQNELMIETRIFFLLLYGFATINE